jgi:uncharacterized membrane protein YadS
VTAGLGRRAIPLFVLCFVGLVILRTVGDAYAGAWLLQWQAALGYAQNASEWLLLVGMAAVGLCVTFSHLREAGWRPVLLSFLAALATGAAALTVVRLL